MIESGKSYKIIKSKIGCKGIDGCIVVCLGKTTNQFTNGLYESDTTCIVKVIKSSTDSYAKEGEIWCINKDCVYEEIKEKINSKNKPSWQNVFDCKKVFPKDFYSCIDIAKSINYPFICFNGRIYATNKGNFNDPIGDETDLK